MKLRKPLLIIVALIFSVIITLSLSACGNKQNEEEESPDTRTLPPPPPPSTVEPTPEPLSLAPYNGIIEHIFLHEVIAWPEVAFSGSRRESLDAEYITADEFRRILNALYNNNYILINLNDVYSEYMTETGHYRLRQNTLELPSGKKPIVISFDNMNFNVNLAQHGFMSRYIIGVDGQIWAEGIDPEGNRVVSQDLTAITILDKFISENPNFSHNGARGCLALTGAQGILGYRTQKSDEEDVTGADRLRRMHEVALVQPVIARLHETGWYFASHTYSRSNLGSMTLTAVQEDAERWLDEVASLVGTTKILTYPAGSRLDNGDTGAPGPAFQYYVGLGFRYFAASGTNHYARNKEDYNITAIIQDRAFMCGQRLRYSRELLLRFFDVVDIFDSSRPDFGNNWE